MNAPVLSVVVPVFNEEKVLKEFHARLGKVLAGMGVPSEILFVNDGSSDGSEKILGDLKKLDARVRTLSFTRNFGHQIAVKAGLDHAQGSEAVVVIDADLQDPPEMIADLWAKHREGYDVVYAVRVHREGETFFKKFTASLYYRLIRSIASIDIPRNTGDFRLISRQAADAIKGMREKNPYLRGLVAWTGFKAVGLPMQRAPRFAGETKYSMKKMCQLAWSGITQFSFMPLQIATFFGVFSLALAAGLLVCLSADAFSGRPVTGTRLILFSVFFLGGIQLVSVGILGAYLGRHYDESRPRPLYVLKKEEA